ncbi:MAG: carboxylating nicotinate-nucleotide diphosphorylase [Ruminococcaceae bacterium]|nr:carboxylating nicotinate-nucleotide diphosphorylase [Oscillospiraceae bacterium]
MKITSVPSVNELIKRALEEDAGNGDITTTSTIPESAVAFGRYIAKEDGVLCGMPVVRAVFDEIDENIELNIKVNEGERFKKGDILAEVRGNARCVLTGERVGLNLLQHLSAIATRTAEAVEKVQGYKAKITDTRKTTPGLRYLEKLAVRVGGGTNHRYNLSDGVLIKDNHIVAAGGITNAVKAARNAVPHTLKIEVEVEDFDQLNEALDAGADIIMLDNMSCEDMRKAVEIVNGRAYLEASGNMGERELSEVAATGVDIISIGALTHSVKAMDISLKFKLI